MKIKSTYLSHVFDRDFKITDYLVEEEGDLESLRKFLGFESGGDLKELVQYVFFVLNQTTRSIELSLHEISSVQ